MKFHRLTPAFAFLAFAQPAPADEADKQRIKELEEQMAALKKDKAEPEPAPKDGETPLLSWTGKVNPKITNAVVIIEGDVGAGTGFMVSTEGKKFLYTAAHVLSGNSKLTIRNAAGTQFKKFGDLQAAEGADLIRVEVLEEVADTLELVPAGTNLEINTRIAALGNGGGNGVVSAESGKILGTSGDSLEVDAGIIQGNSGGPVVEKSNSRAVGVVTHLTSERKDLWSEGTRQGEVRRFACRLNKEWKWKTLKVGAFLAEGRALNEFDNLTRLGFAMAQLEPQTNGMRLDTSVGENVSVLEILDQNKDSDLVKSLISMNVELGSRKGTMSDADLKKKFRSLLAQFLSRAERSNEALKPQNFAWFHRNRSEVSVKARQECIGAIKHDMEVLK